MEATTPRILAIVNHKGGVGKTTTALNLGRALSLQDRRVLLVDIDPQANLSQSLGYDEATPSLYDALIETQPLRIEHVHPNLDLAPADLDLEDAAIDLMSRGAVGYYRLQAALAPVQGQYDYILIDCPPALGILSQNAMITASEIMIVVQAQYLSIKGLNTILRLVQEMKTINKTLRVSGLLVTHTDRTTLTAQITELLREAYAETIYHTTIRRNVAVGEASLACQDVFSYAPRSHAALDYAQLAEEVIASESRPLTSV